MRCRVTSRLATSHSCTVFSKASAHLQCSCYVWGVSAGVARPRTPFRVVEALAARGAPDVALAVQRCRGAPPADLAQVQVLLDVRLAEGLLTDAVTQVPVLGRVFMRCKPQ